MDILSYALNKKYINELKDKVTKHLMGVKEPQRPIGHTKQVSGYGYVRIPSNAKGQINATIKGMTVINLVGEDGDFEKDSNGNGIADGWGISFGTNYALEDDAVFGQKSQRWYGNGSQAHSVVAKSDFILKQNHKYYASCYFKTDTSHDKCTIRFYPITATLTVTDSDRSAIPLNQWSKKSFITECTAEGTVTIYLSFDFADAATCQNAKMQVDGFMLIDLTETFGAGNEPTLEECDKIFNFVNGVKSTLSGVVKTVGKNLFNLKAPFFLYPGTEKIDINEGFKIRSVTDGNWRSVIFSYNLEPNVSYTLKANAKTIQGESYISVYDAVSGTFITGTQTNVEYPECTFTTPGHGKVLIKFFCTRGNGGTGEVDYTNIQLEKGTVATEYEPYHETAFYLPNDVVLRSLTNGVKDEISAKDGKLIKKTEEIILDGNLNWSKVEGYDDVNSFPIGTYISELKNSPHVALNNGQFRRVSGLSNDVPYVFNYDPSTGYIWLRVPVTTGILADAISWLNENPVTLIYQLATPIVSEVDVVGDLVAYPNGTIWVEPCIWGFMTEPKKVVTTPDLPIQEVRKVIRYDISENGKLVETDVTANVTVGDNNTSLTIANFERGKVYFYDCSFAQELSTQAEIIADVEVDNGIVTHDYGASVADWILDSNESKATMLVCTNAGGNAKIIAPAVEGKMYVIRNQSGYTITLKTQTSTGITVANEKTATVIFYGADFIKVSEI